MARKFSLAYLTIPGTNPMDQIKIAKEADGYDRIVASGGDGTLDEVVTGVDGNECVFCAG